MAVTTAASALMSGSASGAVTIGANLLGVTPLSSGYNCNDAHQCTVVNTSLGPGVGAPGGLASPVKGKVVSFEVRTGPSTDSVVFRILRPAGEQLTGAGTSGPVTPPVNSFSPAYPVGLPIEAGDLIGLNCCRSGNNSITTNMGDGNFATWGTLTNQPLADGETRASDAPTHTGLLLMSAVVEPDNQLKIKKARVKGRFLRLRLEVPNPGVVGTLNPGVGVAGSAATAGYRGFVRGRTIPVTPGLMKIRFRLTHRGRAQVALGKKVRAAIIYTPTFGMTTTRRVKARG